MKISCGAFTRKGGRTIAATTVPVFAPGSQASTPWRWLLSAGLLAALLQSAIFAIVDPDLAGWHPYHEHVAIGGYVVDHTHPWDDDHRHGPGLVDPDAGTGEASMTFAGMGSGLAGSVTAPAIAGAAHTVDFAALPGAALPLTSPGLSRGHTPEVMTPPPRS